MGTGHVSGINTYSPPPVSSSVDALALHLWSDGIQKGSLPLEAAVFICLLSTAIKMQLSSRAP